MASPPISPAVAHVAPYATVVLDRGAANLDKELTYAISPEQRERLQPGFAVLVPFGRQSLTAYVTGFTDVLDFDPTHLRPITRLVSKAPVFDANALKLARWMSAYYHSPL